MGLRRLCEGIINSGYQNLYTLAHDELGQGILEFTNLHKILQCG